MWQEISGSCHRNIDDHQHVTGPLQGGKGFPVFPERKGIPSKKLGLEVGKSVIENQKKRSQSFIQKIRIFQANNTYLLIKQYVCYATSISRLMFR